MQELRRIRRTPCDTCGHEQADHNEQSGCECGKFVYPTPALVFRSRFGPLAEGPSRDSLEDVLDDIFGLRYSREMKGLLRDAFRAGLKTSGVEGDKVEKLVDERGIGKLWETQRKYTRHMKNDLKAAIKSDTVKTVNDLEAWFGQNDYRSQLTGRFMAWQGVNAGFARGLGDQGYKVQWTLGARVQHCAVCLSRSGKVYTYEEVIAIGPPGSDSTLCKSACGCTLRRVASRTLRLVRPAPPASPPVSPPQPEAPAQPSEAEVAEKVLERYAAQTEQLVGRVVEAVERAAERQGQQSMQIVERFATGVRDLAKAVAERPVQVNTPVTLPERMVVIEEGAVKVGLLADQELEQRRLDREAERERADQELEQRRLDREAETERADRAISEGHAAASAVADLAKELEARDGRFREAFAELAETVATRPVHITYEAPKRQRVVKEIERDPTTGRILRVIEEDIERDPATGHPSRIVEEPQSETEAP